MSSVVPRFFVRYAGHVTFELGAPTGEVLLIDPFFGDAFPWEGHVERRLTPAAVRPAEITSLSAILVTHVHADHYEPESVLGLADRLDPQVLAPQDVVDDLAGRGVPSELLHTLSPGARFTVGPWGVLSVPSAAAEEDDPCTRYAFFLECNDRVIFHSGDSHGYSPGWDDYRGRVDLALVWYPYMREIAERLEPREAVFMHYDRFEPGGFLCTPDPQELLGEAEGYPAGPHYRVLERGVITAFV